MIQFSNTKKRMVSSPKALPKNKRVCKSDRPCKASENQQPTAGKPSSPFSYADLFSLDLTMEDITNYNNEKKKTTNERIMKILDTLRVPKSRSSL